MAKKALLVVTSICIALLIGEVVLRSAGIRPGYAWQLPFTVIDSVVQSKDWQVDANGIYCMSPQVNKIIATNTKSLSVLWQDNNIDLATKYLIASHTSIKLDADNIQKLEGEELANEFIKQPTSAFEQMLNNSIEDSVDYYYRQFYTQPINANGFYSIPFQNFQTKKKKVLLVGDSFTFGFSAVPAHNSFACNLAAKGYAVYNAGIPGTDPAQYCKIVETYIDSIRPDAVVVCFYAGNDIMPSDRILHADSFVYFPTNASWIKGYNNGSYFANATLAYNYFSQQAQVIPNSQSVWHSITMHSALATQLFKTFGAKQSSNPMDETTTLDNDSLSWSAKYISRINELCALQNVQCILTVIPHRDDLQVKNIERDQKVFANATPHYFPASKADYYQGADDHFNNEGHLKMANFIEALLQKRFDK